MKGTGTWAALALLLLAGCGGGGSSTPTVVPTPVPTPTPLVFSGTYNGAITYNLAGLAEIRGTGNVAVTQNGNALDFGRFTTTLPQLGTASYQLGTATAVGNTFTGTSSYNSSGCGVVNVAWDGRFAGTLMNLHVSLRPTGRASGCDPSEIRGELSR